MFGNYRANLRKTLVRANILMKPEEFITFGSTNRTLDQFVNDGWNPLAAYKFYDVPEIAKQTL